MYMYIYIYIHSKPRYTLETGVRSCRYASGGRGCASLKRLALWPKLLVPIHRQRQTGITLEPELVVVLRWFGSTDLTKISCVSSILWIKPLFLFWDDDHDAMSPRWPSLSDRTPLFGTHCKTVSWPDIPVIFWVINGVNIP